MTCQFIANADTIRVTRLDSCGRPICGVDNGFVFDCFAELAMNVNVEDGEDVEYKAANGRLCAFKRGCPSFRGYDLELTFHAVSPEFIEITTGNPVVFGFDGQPIGYDDCTIQCHTGFALELWAEVIGEDLCEADGTGGQWIYFLLPWVTNGYLGDLAPGSEAVSLTLSGATRTGGGWGVGPYDVMPINAGGTAGPLLTPVGQSCHRRTFRTSIEPPEPICDYVPVTGGVCLAS
ncbi:hypothetical protein GCM10010387_15510 [Streptomyces inusitatus]|uniref:Uncharacterized protein n=1 Tax=Streptomyces inusitatus TaxID=68221 RepID=A0A918PUM3_9ACTN|nr:hypothetical protein [Streptomyces inusitatus]GGZ23289.1 hypothetical protein GCM10010387_15510 [Streptomyces inusitatus]